MKKNSMNGICLHWYVLRKALFAMKLTTLIFLISTLSLMAGESYSQDTRISLNMKNVQIKDVLLKIENSSEFFFIYNNQLIDVDRNVSITVNNEKISDVLRNVFQDQQVEFQLTDRKIVIVPTEMANQQSQTKVSGKVTDTTGAPLPGVSIVIKGTSTGTITDANGNYSLSNVPSNATLQYSFVGMKMQEIAVGSNLTINVTLAEESIGIEEVVAIGYGTQRKSDVTSSVSTVKSSEFLKGNVKDAGQLIQGKVAGLTITSNSGDPLANTQISLRGNTTLFGTSSSPLVLVDGVPGDFNSVAPEDIESIDVLKDGSAAAIYGTRGTNGVILITTKRASGTYDTTVEYTGYMSTQTIAQKLNMMTAEGYRQQIVAGTRSKSDDLGATTNWLDEITQTPLSHVQNLTFRGGNEKTNYLASLNYNDTEGIFLKTGKRTFTARTDVNHYMFNGLVKFNMGLISRNIYHENVSSTNYTYRQALIYNPTAPIKNADGSWYENPGAFNYDNPVSRIHESDGDERSQWSRMNATVTINPFEGFTLKALTSFSKYNSRGSY